LRDDENAGRVCEASGDQRAGLFDRIGIDDEQRLRVLAGLSLKDGEGFRMACSEFAGGGYRQ
jgi:hypothetical protein